MAVTVEELAISLRLSPDGLGLSAAQTGILSRYLGVGTAYIDLLIPAAPVDIQDECIIRLASYLHDQPLGRRDSYSNAWVYSGAGALASKFHPQGASASGEHDASTTVTGGLNLAQVQELIAQHRSVTAAHHVPPVGDGGAGFPNTRTQVLSVTALTLNTSHTPSEAWIASHLYELVIGGEETFLFLTKASGAQVINYDDTRAASHMVAQNVDRQPSIRVAITVGSTATMVAYTDSPTNASQTVVINKLT